MSDFVNILKISVGKFSRNLSVFSDGSVVSPVIIRATPIPIEAIPSTTMNRPTPAVNPQVAAVIPAPVTADPIPEAEAK